MDGSPEKAPRVLDMLERLRATLGAGAFDVVDHWGVDAESIGIASPRDHRVLAYISIADDGFYVELELPPLSGDARPYRVAGRHLGLTFERLAAIVAEHFVVGMITESD